MGLFNLIFGKKKKKNSSVSEYDSEGYNAQGYNREGYDRTGYNIEGYSKYGYDRQGYDKKGFNGLGFDRLGFDSEGFNEQGYNRLGYDRKGFDSNGYDVEGYDNQGYSKNGYDRQGYNKQGFNSLGFNRLGFDIEGFNEQGYNRLGYDRNGFDSNGYDVEGYDIQGYSKSGYDRQGYNKQGFNSLGFNCLGFDIEGFNEQGYNRLGYDRNGFDSDGYDTEGYDIHGYSKNGYECQVYDKQGCDTLDYNLNGQDINGISCEDSNNYTIYRLLTFLKQPIQNLAYAFYEIKEQKKWNVDLYKFNEQGFNELGYSKTGKFITEYDEEGFDSLGFDAFGYNIDGYDSKGYNRLGYNQNGYDINGISQNDKIKFVLYQLVAIVKESMQNLTNDVYAIKTVKESKVDLKKYDEQGFNELGYSKTGRFISEYNKNGFDSLGFDAFGYDIDGYDAEGYSVQGYSKNGYNRQGFDRQGFNEFGFDALGYDADGYDIQGYSKAGYNREGYDSAGFNILGFDSNGYDALGYDVEGYDIQGYSKTGYNRQGYDKAGFNELGFNRYGYDAKGFNKQGFNRKGYDREGFDRDGYNEFKLNRAGFDCYGYNVKRLNSDGFSITGFDVQGFDEFGYDYQGYNREGYNQAGYNHLGFNKSGINIYGHHFNEYDSEGFLKETGFNDLGYDVNGYDEFGYDKNGYDESGYDREGYLESGFDHNGYNREGYNSTGYNQLGYDKFGYNHDGYDENGFDCEGYDRDGFNLSGYDQSGFDKNGYDIYGYDRKGFTAEENRLLNTKNTKVNDLKDGDTIYSNIFGPLKIVYRDGKILYVIGDKLDSNPRTNGLSAEAFAKKHMQKSLYSVVYGNLIFFQYYDKDYIYVNKQLKEVKRLTVDSFNANGNKAPDLYLNVPESWILAEDGYSEEVFLQELHYLERVNQYVDTKHLEKLRNKIKAEIEERYRKENPMNFSGFGMNALYENTIQNKFDQIKAQIKRQAYFASFILNDKQIYLGRNEIISPDDSVHIASWTDKKIAQYYYQYDAYIGNKEIGLSLVRDYTIVQDRLFMYFDKFNAKVDQAAKDDRMTKLLQAHRHDKHVSDIVNSIQKTQYEIMSQDLNEELLVLGCAGSGKTMILFHRLSYILANFDLDINDVYLVSPTNLLTIQTDQLSKNLNIDKANRLTVQQFVNNIYQYYCESFGLYNTLVEIEQNNCFTYDLNCFDLSTLNNYVNQTKTRLESDEYKEKEYRRIFNSLNRVKKLIINDEEIKDKSQKEKIINDYIELNEKAKTECKKYSFRNIELMQESLITYMEDLEEYSEYFELILLFKKYNLLTGVCTNDQKEMIKNIKSDHELIDEILAPLARLTRGYNIDELNATVFDTPKLFVEYLVRNSKTLMKYEIEEVQKLLNKVVTISEELANEMIHICKKAHKDYSLAKNHYDVLEYLKFSNYIGKDDVMKNGEVYGIDLNSYKKFNKTFELFDRFNWNQNIDIKFQLTEEVKDPFDFYSLFEYLNDRNTRFKKFKAGNYSEYIFDMIFDLINPTRSIFKKTLKTSYDHLFSLTYVLVNIYGNIKCNQKIIFLDEFQDLAPSEILMMKKAYSNSIFNYYGDVFQCMNLKGINNSRTINELLPNAKVYNIMVNYRNAQEITQYVNDQMPFVEKMRPTGIKGEIKEVIRDEKAIRHVLKYTENDRIAYIVKDKSSVEENIRKSLDLIDIAKYVSTNIPIGRVVLYSVQEAKGLEFDIVIVDSQNMNVNEKYVAYTRALNKLFVVK